MSYEAIFRCLLLVLGLEVPRIGQVESQGWLLLVTGLSPLSKRYGVQQMLLVLEILGKSEAGVKTGCPYVKATGNNLGGPVN